MIRTLAVALSAASLISASGLAAPWIEELDPGHYVTDLSYDGTAAAGNVTGDGSYETFRWTRDGGIEYLGLATVPTIGVGGGSPDISYDGKNVSASILSSDWQLTLGIWNIDTGWTEAFPPAPEFGKAMDQAYGSAWGLSGDGQSVVGYYYFDLNPGTRVQPCAWNLNGTLTDYESSRGRADAASYNGSVVTGWEDSGLGPWFPMAWRDGTKYYLSDALGSTTARAVNLDGSIIVGDAPDEFGAMKVAAIWRWNGAGYDTQLAGYLPETSYSWGAAYFTGVTDNGSVAVGSNRLAFNPGQGVKAIIWTPESGLVSGDDYLASLGITLPENFELSDFQTISPDGSVIAAAGINLDWMVYQTILIHLHEPCPADINNDRQVDDLDFVSFAGGYDTFDCADPSMPLRCPADINHDGQVDDADFVLFASAYDALLCS